MEENTMDDAPIPETPDSVPQDPLRARMMRRFEVWLDEVLTQESGPAGVAREILEQLQAEQDEPARKAPARTDLYTLLSGFTAMYEETRSQSKSFQSLHESLQPMQGMVDSVRQALEHTEKALENQDRQMQQQSQKQALARVLDVLLDTRDRLVQGLDSARAELDHYASPAGRWGTWRGKPWAGLYEGTARLVQGMDLALTGLDEALQQWGVRPIDCQDRPFDPQTMTAVDRAEVPEAADGTVMAVRRPGYRWDDQIYRKAEVKVVKNGAKT